MARHGKAELVATLSKHLGWEQSIIEDVVEALASKKTQAERAEIIEVQILFCLSSWAWLSDWKEMIIQMQIWFLQCFFCILPINCSNSNTMSLMPWDTEGYVA